MQSQMGRRAGCWHLGSQGANLWKGVVSSGNSSSASSRKPRSQPLLQKGFLRCPGSRLLTQNVTVANQCKGQRLSQSVADVFISSFPLEECSHTHPTPPRTVRAGGAPGALWGSVVYLLVPEFLFSQGSCAAAPRMLFIFSCEGLVTAQGVVYPVRLFIAQPLPWPEQPPCRHFTSRNPTT